MHSCENTSVSANLSLMQFPNFSDDSLRNFIQDEQLQKNLAIVPTFVYLALMFALGAVGNPLIILVYARERKRTATRYFIVSIAVVDLTATIVTLPVTFYVNFRSLQMENVYVCKFYFFVNFSNASISAFLLLSVAFVRFRKICYPFGWQVNIVHACRMNVAIAVFCLGFSIPHIIVHGRQVQETGIPGLCYYLCRVDQAHLTTPWPKVVNGAFVLIFLSCSGTMCFLYARIGRRAMRRGEKGGGAAVVPSRGNSKSATSDLSPTTSAMEGGDSSRGELHKSVDSATTSDETKVSLAWEENTLCPNLQTGGGTQSVNANDQSKCNQGLTKTARESFTFFKTDALDSQKREKDKRRHLKQPRRRTTYMLLTITVVYVVTNLTTLILMFVRSVADQFILSLSPVWASVYSFFFNLFLLNCAVNPIIYSMWDANFRNECRKLFRRKTKK